MCDQLSEIADSYLDTACYNKEGIHTMLAGDAQADDLHYLSREHISTFAESTLGEEAL